MQDAFNSSYVLFRKLDVVSGLVVSQARDKSWVLKLECYLKDLVNYTEKSAYNVVSIFFHTKMRECSLIAIILYIKYGLFVTRTNDNVQHAEYILLDFVFQFSFK